MHMSYFAWESTGQRKDNGLFMYNFTPKQSPKQELDAWWTQLLSNLGATTEQIEEVRKQTEEFKARTAEFHEVLDEKAREGRKPGEDINDFKIRKLKSLQLLADKVNELED